MKNYLLSSLLTSLVILAGSGVAFAQEEGPINFSNNAQKEITSIDEEGNEITELVNVDIVVPGDVILYTSTFTNQGEIIVSDLAVDNPVPENTAYIGFSARGANTQVVFSVDDGASHAGPAELRVVGENGELRTALPEEYTNIRWIFSGDLAPGQSSSVTFKVRIL